jgi:hypothetical protein
VSQEKKAVSSHSVEKVSNNKREKSSNHNANSNPRYCTSGVKTVRPVTKLSNQNCTKINENFLKTVKPRKMS